MSSHPSRLPLLVAAVGLAVAVNVVHPWSPGSPATEIGAAGVALGGNTARAVEQVEYRQDVERVGDVVIAGGEPVGDPVGPVAAMWDVVDGVWPASLRDDLVQLSVVREAPRGLVGVVHPSAAGGWILSLDLADIDDRELIVETIVHESSHVVTLDPAVFRFGPHDDCDGVQIELGCAARGSVLARFTSRFWPDGEPSDDPRDFVNDYAASAPNEDLSETFTAWTLGWPVSGDVIDAKFALLAADPGLAALARELRASILAPPDGG